MSRQMHLVYVDEDLHNTEEWVEDMSLLVAKYRGRMIWSRPPVKDDLVQRIPKALYRAWGGQDKLEADLAADFRALEKGK